MEIRRVEWEIVEGKERGREEGGRGRHWKRRRVEEQYVFQVKTKGDRELQREGRECQRKRGVHMCWNGTKRGGGEGRERGRSMYT